jgi:hypothetical protein
LKRKLNICILGALLIFRLPAKGQVDCRTAINSAEELYNNGDFAGSSHLLTKSLETCSHDRKSKERVLEWLTKSNLAADQPLEADLSMKKLLKNNPYYDLKESDHPEDFNLLYKKFKVHPLFSIGVRTFLSSHALTRVREYSILEYVDYKAPYEIQASTVPNFALAAEFEFVKNLSFNMELNTTELIYSRRLAGEASRMSVTINFIDTIKFLNVPLYFKFYKRTSKSFYPVAQLGLNYMRVYSSTGNLHVLSQKQQLFAEDIRTDNFSLPGINMLGQRTQNLFAAMAGAGVVYQLLNFRISFELRYCLGINSLTDANNRLDNKVLVSNYYIDNSIKLNKLETALTISTIIKNSIKKGRAKLK